MKIEKKNIDTAKLITPIHYGKDRNLTKQSVGYLVDNNLVDYVEIDGVKFIYLNDKSLNYTRKRSF